MPVKPTPESLRRLIDQGNSDAACGRCFGISKYAIRRLRRRWDISARRPLVRHEDEPDLKADRWRQGDLDQAQIASIYGHWCYGPQARSVQRPSSHKVGAVPMSSRLDGVIAGLDSHASS